MNLSIPALVIIFSLTSPSTCDKVKTCLMCTSENGNNKDCEGNINPDSTTNGVCDPQYGNDYCYVAVTYQKQPVEVWMWNRGCCTPKAGSTVCPISEPNHVANEVYEMWRARCDKDDCNTMDPRTHSGGGEGFEGSLVVHGKRNNARKNYGGISLLTLFTLVTVLFFN